MLVQQNTNQPISFYFPLHVSHLRSLGSLINHTINRIVFSSSHIPNYCISLLNARSDIIIHPTFSYFQLSSFSFISHPIHYTVNLRHILISLPFLHFPNRVGDVIVEIIQLYTTTKTENKAKQIGTPINITNINNYHLVYYYYFFNLFIFFNLFN